MLIEAGQVVAVEDSAVWVRTRRQSTCGSCNARNGCGHGIMDSAMGGREHLVRALAEQPLPQPGDEVQVRFAETSLLRAAVGVYLMPLLLMIAAAVVAEWVFATPVVITALASVLGLVLGFLLLAWQSRRYQYDRRMQPVVEKPFRHSL